MMNSKGLPSYFNTPDDPQVQQDLAEWHRDLSGAFQTDVSVLLNISD